MKKIISFLVFVFSVLIIFNICFFVCIDYDGNKAVCLCYLFFHLAYALTLLTCFFTTRRKLGVLNSMLYIVSVIYLLVTAVTIVVFLVSNVDKETVIIVCLFELMLYLVSFHYCNLANIKAEKGVVKELKSSSNHSHWIAELRVLEQLSDDERKVKILNNLIGEIMSSPSSSNSYVYRIDNDIKSQIDILQSNFESMQLEELSEHTKYIVYNIRKRTDILKYSNNKI